MDALRRKSLQAETEFRRASVTGGIQVMVRRGARVRIARVHRA